LFCFTPHETYGNYKKIVLFFFQIPFFKISSGEVFCTGGLLCHNSGIKFPILHIFSGAGRILVYPSEMLSMENPPSPSEVQQHITGGELQSVPPAGIGYRAPYIV
jgi:hypothetical protein